MSDTKRRTLRRWVAAYLEALSERLAGEEPDPCPSSYAGLPCQKEPGHEGKHAHTDPETGLITRWQPGMRKSSV